ncbi:MAG: SAM-dependent methyltransferase [Chloroflexi bacterium]|nr:SAM-dependent methyltransferase [Chloroflexota bacterium]
MNPATLHQELSRRLSAEDHIPFAQFMELALYWPNGGYYARPRQGGQDFYTAPAAHPAFGALLVLQLEEMWRILGRPTPFVVLEPGAGWGHLALDVTSYACHLDPAFTQALRYVAIDRAAHPMPGPGALAHWVKASGVPLRGVTGCILANELFDAMPVHRLVMRGGHLRETFVISRQGRLSDVEGEPSTPALTERLSSEGVALAEGQQAEVCLALEPWLEEASHALERGFFLILDYGHPAQELYSPWRVGGTLRCYYMHTVSSSPYDYPGGQDITAHVDFTALVAAGQRCGLESYPLVTQGDFLRNLGLPMLVRRLAAAGVGQVRRDANRMAMLELARRGGMGDFRVLIQSKGVPPARLTGLEGPAPAWKERMVPLPLPLLDGLHLDLMAARYPHAAQDFEDLWR